MATIKSYTDIEQSKALAKILPIESADMIWANGNDVIVVPYDMATRENVLHDFIPCWSLAALLGVLPYGYSSILTKSFNGKDYYCKIDGKSFESKADNPIDACYEMILKLNELKML